MRCDVSNAEFFGEKEKNAYVPINKWPRVLLSILDAKKAKKKNRFGFVSWLQNTTNRACHMNRPTDNLKSCTPSVSHHTMRRTFLHASAKWRKVSQLTTI